MPCCPSSQTSCTRSWQRAKITKGGQLVIPEAVSAEERHKYDFWGSRWGKYVKHNKDKHKDPSAYTTTNWAGVYAPPVQNQGTCGDCWAFSATEQMASDATRLNPGTTPVTLSAIQARDCTTEYNNSAHGCDGGLPSEIFQYASSGTDGNDGAIAPMSSYTSGCDTTTIEGSVQVTDAYKISRGTTAATEADMKSHLENVGTLSICVADAGSSTWQNYESGVIGANWVTKAQTLDHAIVAVGFATPKSASSSLTSHYIVQNSWGTNWGDSGFINIAYGNDAYLISSEAYYTDVTVGTGTNMTGTVEDDDDDDDDDEVSHRGLSAALI